jgi:uncharacterized membrane protein YhaH (DUF805 family)
VGPAQIYHTIRNTLTLEGRATRTEVSDYTLVALLMTVIFTLVAGFVAGFDLRNLIGDALACVIAIPVPALLVRRFHDQDRTGRWIWLPVFVFTLWALRTAWSLALGIESRIELDRTIWPLDWLAIIASIITVVLIVLPGTIGTNRFGPDPRSREG